MAEKNEDKKQNQTSSTIDDKEKEVLKYWNQGNIFEKSLDMTKGKNEFIFYDGPPFATGLPHYGHMLASVIKDLVGRFRTMKGNHVRRVWGWDCHGLPIESIAEKELGIKSKDEIEKMGIKKFNDFCRSKVLTYAGEWKKIIERIGRWVDMDNAYKTMDTSYIESVWWVFKQLYDKGYIYEGKKILMYCPHCSTPLSKSEIAMDNSYKTVKDRAVTVSFKLKKIPKNISDSKSEVYAIAWTTTPWTLPSNLALTVHPDLDYVYLKDNSDGKIYLLAKSLVGKYFKSEEEYQILEEIKGKELEGLEYEPLFPYFKDRENAFKFILGDFVTEEEGTGIVHTAPAFGEDDYNVCNDNKIPLVQPVDEQGKFTDEVKDFAGEYIFDTNKKIIDFLKKQGKVVKIESTSHEYPFCYRCETPLIYRAVPSWFVNIQKIKPRLLELNKKINWYPSFLKNGRVNHNLESAPDWNISRNRYWATAMPIWKSASGKLKVVGSIEELKKYAVSLPEGKEINLHKDYLDQIKLRDESGEEYERVPEVLDCWFESGSMPFAQFHYPFENKEFFEDNFPSQFVAEYIGQTRAWFYYMIVLSTIIFDNIPFENVVTTGTILNKNGEKMSKSKKNYPEPNEIIEKYGVDALRFYLMGSPVMNADNLNFSEREVEEVYKKVILLLYNVNRFYLDYSSISNNDGKLSENLENVSDKWIVSRLNYFGELISEELSNYNTIGACRHVRKFVDELSTWYVRINRDRFNDQSKAAVETLGYVLDNLSTLIAPIMPFVAERMHASVSGKEFFLDSKDSVHLKSWPNFNPKLVNKSLMKNMDFTRQIVSIGLRERDKEKKGLKWPLSKAIIKSKEKLDKEFQDIIKNQLNVREIEFNDVSEEEDELVVELDTNLTPELEAEGYARVLSRKVQALRKKMGMNKEEKIKLFVSSDEELKNILDKKLDLIKDRTNAEELKIVIEPLDSVKNKTFKNINSFNILNKRGEIGIVH